MAKKIKRSNPGVPAEKPSAPGICLVCGSRMLLASGNPDVWHCPKCGAKRVTEGRA